MVVDPMLRGRARMVEFEAPDIHVRLRFGMVVDPMLMGRARMVEFEGT